MKIILFQKTFEKNIRFLRGGAVRMTYNNPQPRDV